MRVTDKAQVKEAMIHYGFHTPNMTVTEFVGDVLTDFEAEPVRHGRCKFCEDLDRMYEVVCYLPHDSGGATDIPINYCPNCGARMDAE